MTNGSIMELICTNNLDDDIINTKLFNYNIEKKKDDLIGQFELSLKETSFDCNLMYNRNYYPKIDENKLFKRQTSSEFWDAAPNPTRCRQ